MKKNFLPRVKEVFQEEINELINLKDNLSFELNNVMELILSCEGKIIFMGIGKMGIIARKISASFTSTGTKAIFIHATEAAHGDLGLIDEKDIVFLISNSGKSIEVINIIDPIKKIGAKIIAMTGNSNSEVAKQALCVLNIGVNKEVCPWGKAPTTSTTAALLMGDALTICLMEERKFTKEDYLKYHPGGKLGENLF